MPRQARTDHVALIGDLVASRQMEGRAALQRHLPAWLAELNRSWSKNREPSPHR